MPALPDPLLPLKAKLDELEAVIRSRFQAKVTTIAPVTPTLPNQPLPRVPPREVHETFMERLARFFGVRR